MAETMVLEKPEPTRLDHEIAQAKLAAFVAGDKMGQFEVKASAKLVLDMLAHFQKATSYQTCHKHGPIHAAAKWRCPECYDELMVETGEVPAIRE